MLRGVLGTCSWKAQQAAPQFAAEIGLMLSECAQPTVRLLIDANKLVRDMRRPCPPIRFHVHAGLPWMDLVPVVWCDASPDNRCDGNGTMGLVAGLSGPGLAQGREDDVTLISWRSAKLPRRIIGSNGGETQALTAGEDLLWLIRLFWSEVHGEIGTRSTWNSLVRKTHGILTSDSKGIFDAVMKVESPLLGLRSARAGKELTATRQNMQESDVDFRWVHGGAMLADSLTKKGYPARGVVESFLSKGCRWKIVHDENFVSNKKRKAAGEGDLEDRQPDDDDDEIDVDGTLTETLRKRIHLRDLEIIDARSKRKVVG